MGKAQAQITPMQPQIDMKPLNSFQKTLSIWQL
jgi:hypothetical protein